MKTRPFKFIIGTLLLTASLILVACGGSVTQTAPTTAPTDEHADEGEHADEHEQAPPVEGADLQGDAVRGGLLYDKWWTVNLEVGGHAAEAGEGEHEHEVSSPEGDQPLWATQSTNTRSGEDTWRCKECHGWDYKGVDGVYGSGSHMTGFPGVYASKDKPAEEVLAALKGSTNPDHDFSTVMEEQDLADLAFFITTALIDDDTLINADKSSMGDSSAGDELYQQVCILCHGIAGNAINFSSMDDPEFLGHLAPDNPWEFVHKVRFGQPGWPMPSGIVNGWSDQDVANVLAFAQGFPAQPALSDGGQLYDKWWEALSLDAPEGDNPLWASQSTNTRSGTDTWRCKECHGWDYLGADGAYGSGSHATGFTGVLGSASLSSDELLSWLNGGENPDHDFSGVMPDYALEALVTFIKDEMVDIASIVSSDGSVDGDPASGKTMFEGTCAACHGVDGRNINFGNVDEPEFVGTVAVDNPWEFFHKISFGQPGQPMPRGKALGWTLEQIADVLAYAQTLPTE